MPVREKLAKRAAKAGLAPPAPVAERLEVYFELLRKWNRKVSLTALPVEEVGDEAIDRLLIEPLLAARHLPGPDSIVIDVGSGGGSPAIPIKLAAPGVSMRMIESKTRKAAFLREVVRSLQLDRTVVDAVRFEELLTKPELRDSADVVTMRAVRVDARTLALLQAFLRPGGVLFLFSSERTMRTPSAVPQFVKVESHPLQQSRGSHLEILRKAETGN